jgi:hypothetical protein
MLLRTCGRQIRQKMNNLWGSLQERNKFEGLKKTKPKGLKKETQVDSRETIVSHSFFHSLLPFGP